MTENHYNSRVSLQKGPTKKLTFSANTISVHTLFHQTKTS